MPPSLPAIWVTLDDDWFKAMVADKSVHWHVREDGRVALRWGDAREDGRVALRWGDARTVARTLPRCLAALKYEPPAVA